MFASWCVLYRRMCSLTLECVLLLTSHVSVRGLVLGVPSNLSNFSNLIETTLQNRQEQEHSPKRAQPSTEIRIQEKHEQRGATIAVRFSTV